MAEAALFSLASKLLGEMSSQAFRKAYKRVQQSIWGAKEDLDKLKEAIQTVQTVLLDAEKKQEHSAAIRDWIERVRDVLYEADDLFDEVATNALLKQQMEGEKLLTKVLASFSKVNPVISNDRIAKKVKAIRKRLGDVSRDVAQFNFVLSPCEPQISGLKNREETRPFVDTKVVVGREFEKKGIMEFLFDKSDDEQSVSVIAIVGIGGMGKTTLAQLIYNDEEVEMYFEKNWWACISNTVGLTNVLERITQSMYEQFHHGCDLKQLISESVISCGKYLLVLDDVWDDDLGIWFDIMSLLNRGAKGSKIIVTTRSSSVPRAMQKDNFQIFPLNGLSEEKSWELFQKIAFTKEQVNDPNWVSLGKEIVKKCANVPLSIKSIASLVCTKDTMLEWESIKNEKLLSEGSIKSVLKLSYDHLQSNLKHCFAYCSLFPKDYVLHKQELVYMWIAHGYVKPREKETPEAAGHAYYMELLRRCFFQKEGDGYGEILSCKMHDLVHDLAQDVAGEECVMLTEGQFLKKNRHVTVAYEISDSWNGPSPVLQVDQLRSCLVMLYSCRSLVFVEQVTKCRNLRALNLAGLSIKDVPSSIGDLKYLRYLNLSKNPNCQALPDSITKLVNLLTLDISSCWSIVALPNDIGKLISLRHLVISDCDSMNQMPPGFGELTSLQHLSDFKVGKRGDDGHGTGNVLGALVGLNLQGSLRICFDSDGVWSEDELMIHIPESVEMLSISDYPGKRIPVWWKEDSSLGPLKLMSLELRSCGEVKHLPPLARLPFLRDLTLVCFHELECIQEVSAAPFFPSLRSINLIGLRKLEGWSRRQQVVAEQIATANEELSFFPLLTHLKIIECFLLKSIPPCPRLVSAYLAEVSGEMVHQLVSNSLPSRHTNTCLQRITVFNCGDLTSFPGEGLTSLRRLKLRNCPSLRNVQLASNALEELIIRRCPDLELWDHRGVRWASLSNIRLLALDKIPTPDELPDCLRHRLALSKLHIQEL